MDGTRSLVTGDELYLYGVVDPFGMSGEVGVLRAVDVVDSLAELRAAPTLVVRINSPGGSVIEGLAIYNALKATGKPITVMVDAMAASIASVIAMAGDEIVMGEGATLMIHDPMAAALGTSEDFSRMVGELERQKGLIVDIYEGRTKLPRAEIEALMSAETFMSAQDAVERGFADRVAEPMRIAACALLKPDELARLLIAPATVRNSRPTPAAPAAHPPETSAMADENIGGGQSTATAVLPPPIPPPDHAAIRNQAVADERARMQGIYSAARAARMDMSFADDMVREGVTLDAARERIIARWAEGQENGQGGTGRPVDTRNHVHVVQDGIERWAQGAQQGLLVRAGLLSRDQAQGNEFVGLTLTELARSALAVRNQRTGSMDRMTMIGTAFTTQNAGPGYHSTSDFGNMLGTVALRALQDGYQEAEETFQLWTGRGTASDFRPMSRIDIGLFPALEKVEEGAEYKYGTVGDTGVTIQIATYGKMFAITRQAIINDDLGAFTRIPQRMGRAARRTVGNLVYAILNGNPVMQDGVTLFNATHGNLATVAAPPTAASLGVARAAMSRQKDPDGLSYGIGVRPRYIIVPPELRDTTATVIGAQYLPGDPGLQPNPVANFGTLIDDPRLSGTAWYLAGDPAQTDTIEVTYLDGNEAPFMDQRVGWNVDGSEFKVRLDAGVKALHWRGLFKNAGL